MLITLKLPKITVTGTLKVDIKYVGEETKTSLIKVRRPPTGKPLAFQLVNLEVSFSNKNML